MADGFFKEMTGDMKGNIVNEIEKLRLSAGVFAAADEILRDGRDHMAEKTVRECIRSWNEMLKKCDEDMKHEAFNIFSEWVREGTLHEKAKIEKLWIGAFNEAAFEEEKCSIIDEKLAECLSDKEEDIWIARRLLLMERRKYDTDAAFEKKYREHYLVSMYLADMYLRHGENCKAYELIKRVMEKYRGHREISEKLCRKMVKICRFMDEAVRKETFRDILTVYLPCDPVIFSNFKKMYRSDEWPSARDELFGQIEGMEGEAALYAGEGMYNRLMWCLRRKCDLDEMLKYEDVLGAKYAADILATYEMIFDDMLGRAKRRKDYRMVIEHMRRLEKYPGGESWMYRTADRWREKYNRKNAFLTELAKL